MSRLPASPGQTRLYLDLTYNPQHNNQGVKIALMQRENNVKPGCVSAWTGSWSQARRAKARGQGVRFGGKIGPRGCLEAVGEHAIESQGLDPPPLRRQ